MRKSKIIWSLSTFASLFAATPIVATSCTNNEYEFKVACDVTRFDKAPYVWDKDIQRYTGWSIIPLIIHFNGHTPNLDKTKLRLADVKGEKADQIEVKDTEAYFMGSSNEANACFEIYNKEDAIINEGDELTFVLEVTFEDNHKETKDVKLTAGTLPTRPEAKFTLNGGKEYEVKFQPLSEDFPSINWSPSGEQSPNPSIIKFTELGYTDDQWHFFGTYIKRELLLDGAVSKFKLDAENNTIEVIKSNVAANNEAVYIWSDGWIDGFIVDTYTFLTIKYLS